MEVKYIPGNIAKRRNAKAMRRKRNYMADETPKLVGGYNLPIVGYMPLDQEWLRCTVPATPDCTQPVNIDTTWADYDKLPVMPSTKAGA
jgi:hypothetical protein